MKSVISIFILFLFCISVSAQEKVFLGNNNQWISNGPDTKKYAIINKEGENKIKVDIYALNGLLKESGYYSVYNEDPKDRIRNGVTRYFYPNGNDSVVITLKDNRRTGQYFEYYPDGQVKIISTYKNGNIDGKFIEYHPNGKLRREEFYTMNKCEKGKLFSEDGEELEFEPYLIMPQFPGGNESFLKVLAKTQKYPAEAQEKKIEGLVVAQIFIDTDGSLWKTEIIKSVDPLLDNEVLRVLDALAMTFKWTPGKVDGEIKRMKVSVPCRFRL